MMEQTTSTTAATVLIIGGRDPSPAGFLEGLHYDVVHVHSGTIALEWSGALQPDAILVESDLPDVTTLEVCRRLSDRGLDPTVPLMLLTPRPPSVGERLAALRVGAWDCLAYPADAEDLALKLHAYLQVRRHMGPAVTERRPRQTSPRIPLRVSAAVP